MRTVVLGPPPPELEQLIERRRALGLDRHDEVWEGSYHMAPEARFGHAYLQSELARAWQPHAEAAGLIGTGSFNLGDPDDFRVPDLGYHRDMAHPETVFLRTAAVVVEILSPHDETFEKLPFYAAHDVEEVVIVDPDARTVTVMARSGDTYQPSARSEALGIDVAELRSAIRWP